MKKLIGTATIQYAPNQEVESVSFNTELINKDSSEIIKEHVKVFTDVKEVEQINPAADSLLAILFSKITDIELRDIETTSITHSIVCEKNNGKIVKCVIEYYLETM